MLKVGMLYLGKIGLIGSMILLVAGCSQKESMATPARLSDKKNFI